MDEKALARLIDEDEIRNVHYRYCRGVDRLDWDLLRSAYHPGAIDDHGAFCGPIEELIPWMQETLPAFEATMHFCGQSMIEIDGDQAWAEHYGIGFHRLAATADSPAVDFNINVRYFDDLERRDGEWRISYRKLLWVTDRTDPVGTPSQLGADWNYGDRGRNDYSYRGTGIFRR